MNQKKINATFWVNVNGNEPVRDWLKSLDGEERKIIGGDIKTIELGFPIGMPVCRPMGDSLYEVRSDLPDKKISRVLFCVEGSVMLLLHGFIKKERKTPKSDLDLAKKRRSEFKQEKIRQKAKNRKGE